ncbi:MFS general substrate transporter [Dacryopinax primogenitus]|uniref:MFS general substrate transporter n=1 Tax=Dacryopinax primogenitus (strain DJM 731) TaxID=1858805 RepID=M5FVH8_DACPD|nr:MFS general substrate transporter [Dacryopinax primogenitus]EJT99614.1 MFS general substrate transporter [Dacryopinax primogenitus]
MATTSTTPTIAQGGTSSRSRNTADEAPVDSPPVFEDNGMNINEMGSAVEILEQLDGQTIRGGDETTTADILVVFKRWEIWVIVYLTSIAALFSPLSANIYFPAIPVIAQAFNEPVELINVTVTVYMILQGTSPMVWGSLADWKGCGRRPIYLACLLLLCLSCVGLALTPTTDYWLLVFLRCVQAAGSASSVAISAGTIMDVAAPHERGTMLAMSSIGALVAPCIGPVIGGLLAGNLGWRSIFWFLCICSGVVLLLEALFLPETLRTITGDGSVPAQKWNRPFIPVLLRDVQDEGKSPDAVRGRNNPIEIIKSFRNIDLCIILWSNAVPYSVLYGILTTMSPTFLAVMPSLTEIDLGLCYLSIGAGGIAGALGSGKLVDWDFRRAKKLALQKQGMRTEDAAEKATDIKGSSKYEGIECIERTRLRLSPAYWASFVVIVIGYGWAAERKVHIACLLILQFLAMFQVTAIFTLNQTLLMDLFPGRGASVTASNNVVRCLTGAVLVSIVDYIINGVGVGWTFTILGACHAGDGLGTEMEGEESG